VIDKKQRNMKASKRLHTTLGLLGIVMCAACCALPIFGVMAGMGTLSVLSKYFEWAGIAAIVLAAVFFVIYVTKKRSSAGCESGCGCSTGNSLSESKAK
jgi:hypothetical protein